MSFIFTAERSKTLVFWTFATPHDSTEETMGLQKVVGFLVM